MILYDLLESAHSTWPRAAPKAHIDDLNHTITGTSDEIFNQLAPAALHVAIHLELSRSMPVAVTAIG